VLWLAAQGARLLLTTKPVRTVDDLKGMLLRPTSPMEARIFQELKISTPSFMPMSEVYTSLQKGIIQGTWVCPEVLASFRLGEVVKYITDVNFGIGVNKYVAMSWQKWNQLPPDIQKVFERESAWGKEEDIKAWNKAFDEGIKFAKSKGAEFIHFPPQELAKIMKVVNAVEDEEAKKLDAKGYPGTALLREMRKAFATGK
jgi:TRAP-type C4-dicarboxylate transport system, periplasmic component